ncbi:Adenine/guanine phosphoribosyltransferase [Rhizobium sp. NFR07]|uniref:phosphoribosyltransferase n=1 Tax=Rhizobium sp. NFR07 TaxID=1566262 RepID=UPI0008E9DC4A|nr:phosphoribosyltransferase [Rhizobium sp. NFR07]SFB18921.1 Adenine/guanine phosphoribosyltransferase [Rhizobium sp. NFR07]
MQPHDFWQEMHPPGTFDEAGPFSGFFPARLDRGEQIRLPIRPLADGQHALASLIINQASFDVQDALAADLAPKIAALRPEVIVGLPTLGLTLAAAVARMLGFARYVPLGTSKKFWYDEALSVPLSSITTPEQQKRLYVDPRMMPLIKGRRVALIDDVISSGTSIVSGLTLMTSLDIEPVAIGAAMLQSDRWEGKLDALGPQGRGRVISCFRTPMLKRAGEGMWSA